MPPYEVKTPDGRLFFGGGCCFNKMRGVVRFRNASTIYNKMCYSEILKYSIELKTQDLTNGLCLLYSL